LGFTTDLRLVREIGFEHYERLVSDGPLLQISAQSIATRALASMLERSAEIKNMGRDHVLRAKFGFSKRGNDR
jgi:hypothetical protein